MTDCGCTTFAPVELTGGNVSGVGDVCCWDAVVADGVALDWVACEVVESAGAEVVLDDFCIAPVVDDPSLAVGPFFNGRTPVRTVSPGRLVMIGQLFRGTVLDSTGGTGRFFFGAMFGAVLGAGVG